MKRICEECKREFEQALTKQIIEKFEIHFAWELNDNWYKKTRLEKSRKIRNLKKFLNFINI